ncbi:UBP1-associated proteins 1C [Heracleum sosnowskyi]|uniref:UBP1-associated proteins 1C n=1 Tax=Heracleum sosnowskyi TaxID=360622 RepID=A0AAD8HEV0_9APIA|nr:UBP1-associated proteins 1C [Heracleum sosnowskyi]
MVWFQCEDCGDNLKKPKLLGHFRMCSANKLSCIDCGQVFGQQSVQGHTQCITEMEKYGPKGQVKVSANATPNPNSKMKPEVDINVGLSERPPWFCSLCNTSATSRQTLLSHADGKKHRGKARAFHASKQPPKQTEELTPSAKVSAESNLKDQLVGNQDVLEPKKSDLPEVDLAHNGSKTESTIALTSKKRKHETDRQNVEVGNDEEDTECKEKKSKQSMGKGDEMMGTKSSAKEVKKNIKWKKLITSALESNPDGVLKLRKLQKFVQKALVDSEIILDKSEVRAKLEHKINSSSRFTVDSKYVRLVVKS